MADKTLDDLPVITTLTNSDKLHARQSAVDYAITFNNLANNILNNSDYSIITETRDSSNDYLASELISDHRIFLNPTAGSFTIGLFNGAIKDGAVLILKVVGTGINTVAIELATDGVTDYTLSVGDTLSIIWDNTNSEWVELYNN